MDKASTRGLHKVRSALPSVSNNNSYSRHPFRVGISRSGRQEPGRRSSWNASHHLSSRRRRTEDFLNMLAALAQHERGLIVERINIGTAAVRKKRNRFGRPVSDSAVIADMPFSTG